MFDVEILKRDDVDALASYLEVYESVDQRIALDSPDLPEILHNFPPLISVCAFFGAVKCFEMLQLNNADLYFRDKKGRLPVHFASAGSLEISDMLDSAGANFDVYDSDRMGSIHFACLFGNFDMVQRLCVRNFDLDSHTNQNMTPLHFACMSNQEEIVEFLIAKNVDINPISNDGLTPVCIALRNGSWKLVKIFADHGLSLDFVESDSMTPLMWACRRGFTDVVKVLHEYLSDEAINRCDELLGWTALHFAAENGNREIVQLLIECGIDVNTQTKMGMTATHLAANRRKEKALRLLEQNGGIII